MKRICVCLLAVLLLLSLSACGEKEKERIDAIAVSSAVCEDGKIVVTYADGFRLDLGEVNTVLSQACLSLRISVSLPAQDGNQTVKTEKDSYLITSTTTKAVASVIAPDAEAHTLSASLFSGAVDTAARYGTQILFFSSTGNNTVIYNGAVGNGNYAFAGNIAGGILASSEVSVGTGTVIQHYFGQSNQTGVWNGNLDSYMVSVNSDAILPDAYLTCNDKIYAPIDAAVLPLLKQHATSVVIPTTFATAKVTEIAPYAFRDFAALTSVTLPKTVTTLGEELFSGCTALTELHFNGTEAEWNTVSKAENWQGGRELQVIFTEGQPSNP